MRDINAVAPFVPTAWAVISMKGKPVGDASALSISPMQNNTAINAANPSVPFIARVNIRLRGMFVEAFWISSLIWTAPSRPDC